MPPQGNGTLSFKAFLSHRYKSPTVNRYFFGIFDEAAEVQFEIDEGRRFPTNVTRLERLIRDCDAFIGIYPFPASRGEPTREALLHESRYFRLELDLAIRARKPGLILYDRRYRQLFKSPAFIRATEFDALEVKSRGGSPSVDLYRRSFQSFCERVAAWKAYEVATRGDAAPRQAVVTVLPTGREKPKYAKRELDVISKLLASHDFTDTRNLPWPPVLEAQTMTVLAEADWVLADVGHVDVSPTLAAYLHGSFTPTMRLQRVDPAGDVSDASAFLYDGTEVGYRKDIVAWDNKRSLEEGLEQRLLALKAPVTRISTAAEADDYFLSAARRKEAVFLSYSGADEQVARELSTALKERFQDVFDYRDGASIRPGKPWLEEIFTRLSTSAVGIPLMSASYVESGNCLHEMREMVARRDGKSMEVIPIKIDPELGDVPAFVGDIQYLRRWDYRAAPDVVDAILENLP